MAQHVNVLFVDDLDGGEAEDTVSFALDGKTYEIDLSAQNLARLHEILAPFVHAGRKTSGAARAPRPAAGGSSDREQNQAVRVWAQAQGLSVSTRGRLSTEVLEAYRARHDVPAVEAPASPEPPAPEPAKRPRRNSTVQQPTFSSAPV